MIARIADASATADKAFKRKATSSTIPIYLYRVVVELGIEVFHPLSVA